MCSCLSSFHSLFCCTQSQRRLQKDGFPLKSLSRRFNSVFRVDVQLHHPSSIHWASTTLTLSLNLINLGIHSPPEGVELSRLRGLFYTIWMFFSNNATVDPSLHPFSSTYPESGCRSNRLSRRSLSHETLSSSFLRKLLSLQHVLGLTPGTSSASCITDSSVDLSLHPSLARE